jgi:exonuclease SbcC
LIEAISWALYGNRSESRNGRDGIKRTGAGPHEDCSVELEFELARVQYRLKRSLRGKDMKPEAELIASGGIIARSERAVTQKIEEILGMDYPAFFVSVFARQKDLSALSNYTPGERKKLIMRMLELDVLQEVLDDIRKEGREEKQALELLNEQLLTPDRRNRKAVLTDEIALLDAQVEQLGAALEEVNRAQLAREEELEAARGRKEWAALKDREYRQVERRVLERQKEVEEARRNAETAAGDLRRFNERLASLPELEAKERELDEAFRRKDAMDEGMARFEQRRSAAQNLNRVMEEVRRTSDALSKALGEREKVALADESLSKVTENMEQLDAEIGTKREAVGLLDAEIKRLSTEIKDIKAKTSEISTLGPESNCPTCERRLGEQHHRLLTKLNTEVVRMAERSAAKQEELSKIREELETAKRRRDVLDGRKKTLQANAAEAMRLATKIEGLEQRSRELVDEDASAQEALAAIGEMSFDLAEHKALRSRIDALKPLADRCKALRGESDRRPDLEARTHELGQLIALREKERDRAAEDLRAVGYQEGDLKTAQDRYDEAFKTRERALTDVSNRLSNLELAKARGEDKRKALEEVEEHERGVAQRSQAVERLATLDKVMADFKQNVMERVVPTLSEVSSQFFTEMTDSRYGGIELDEDYEMQIYDGQEKFSLARFSGGEADLANLSLRLAISRVLADRSGNDINFLILDEIFGSQDQVRKRNIMATLNRLERQFHQIVVITHIDDTKDLMNNVITIKELDDGTSTVEL